jgi:hypothetical protein
VAGISRLTGADQVLAAQFTGVPPLAPQMLAIEQLGRFAPSVTLVGSFDIGLTSKSVHVGLFERVCSLGTLADKYRVVVPSLAKASALQPDGVIGVDNGHGAISTLKLRIWLHYQGLGAVASDLVSKNGQGSTTSHVPMTRGGSGALSRQCPGEGIRRSDVRCHSPRLDSSAGHSHSTAAGGCPQIESERWLQCDRSLINNSVRVPDPWSESCGRSGSSSLSPASPHTSSA